MSMYYQEKHLSKGILLILGIITLVMVGFLLTQLIFGPIGTKPAPNWLLIIIVVFSAAVTVNFSYFTISVSDEGVQAAYGVFKKRLPWNSITSCELDDEKSFYGYGIRYGKYKDSWVWIFNIIGGPRVAVLSSGDKPRGLIFSTKNPDEVIRIIRERIPG